MGEKSLKFRLKNDRVERIENAMLGLAQAVNNNIIRLGKDIAKTHELLEVIYDQTPAGMWARFKKWLSKKR